MAKRSRKSETRRPPYRAWRKSYDAMVQEKSTPLGLVRVLTVRKHSGRDGISWDTLQQIKNDMLGHDAVAVEMYPAAEDLVDEVNCRHLWEVRSEWTPFNLNRRW